MDAFVIKILKGFTRQFFRIGKIRLLCYPFSELDSHLHRFADNSAPKKIITKFIAISGQCTII